MVSDAIPNLLSGSVSQESSQKNRNHPKSFKQRTFNREKLIHNDGGTEKAVRRWGGNGRTSAEGTKRGSLLTRASGASQKEPGVCFVKYGTTEVETFLRQLEFQRGCLRHHRKQRKREKNCGFPSSPSFCLLPHTGQTYQEGKGYGSQGSVVSFETSGGKKLVMNQILLRSWTSAHHHEVGPQQITLHHSLSQF